MGENMSITRMEEMLLLTIFNLKENAYLIGIKEYFKIHMGKKLSLSSIHIPLSRLEDRGLIEGHFGEATAVRGGRRKKIYSITAKGFEELAEHKRLNDILWENYSF